MKTELLLQLAAALEANAANPQGVKFDLRGWGYDATEEIKGVSIAGPVPARAFQKGEEIPLNCNTAACAAGLAALMGLGGLSFDIVSGRGTLVPTFAGYTGWSAVEMVFGLNCEEAETLFSPDCYPLNLRTGAEAERNVAKRIRGLVARHEAK